MGYGKVGPGNIIRTVVGKAVHQDGPQRVVDVVEPAIVRVAVEGERPVVRDDQVCGAAEREIPLQLTGPAAGIDRIECLDLRGIQQDDRADVVA